MSSKSRFIGSSEEFTHNITTCDHLYTYARYDEKIGTSQSQRQQEEENDPVKKKRKVDTEMKVQENQQYLVHTILDTISSEIPSLLLCVTDVLNVWMIWLDMEAFKKHRESLGIPSTSWNELLTLFRTAFERDDKLTISIPTTTTTTSPSRASSSSSTSYIPPCLRLSCTYTLQEVELCGTFILYEVGTANIPTTLSFSLSALYSSSNPTYWRSRTLQQVMFQLMDRIRHPTDSNKQQTQRRSTSEDSRIKDRRIAELENELSSVRAELSRLHEIQASMDAQGHHGHSPTLNSSPTAKKKHTVIAKTNMSILNPGQKKRKQKGVKIL